MKEKIDERIKNIPDKIYLQVGDNIGWEVDFKELEDTGEVTWCSDKIEKWDIEYIRASELERLVSQEVGKRIAERMPSPSDKLKGLREYQFNVRGRHEKDYITEDFLEGVEWLRSRLTCSEKPNNLKTEGGGE